MEACIYLEDGTKLKGVNIFSVKAEPMSKVISAPLETGNKSADCKVREPLRITVQCTIVASDTSSETIRLIDQMFMDQDLNLYSVCDGIGSVYRNLVLKGMPHNRGSKEFDFMHYNLVFVEAMLVQGEGENSPSNNENTDFRTYGFNQGTVIDFGSMPIFQNYA